MLYAGWDLSRQRLDVHLLAADGTTLKTLAVSSDTDALSSLAARVAGHGQPVTAVIESMNGARFVHDQLERLDWQVEVADAQQVEVADAQRVEGLAQLAAKAACRQGRWPPRPLAAKAAGRQGRLHRRLGAGRAGAANWCPPSGYPRRASVSSAHERASGSTWCATGSHSENRIHATLIAFGHPRRSSDPVGVDGRASLARLELPEHWTGTVAASLQLIDELHVEIRACVRDLRTLGGDHPLCGAAGDDPAQRLERSDGATRALIPTGRGGER